MRGITAFILISFLIPIPLAAFAATTAPISVPAEGDHYYWFVYTDLSGKTIQTTPRSFKDKKTTADLPLVKDAVPKCRLCVLDGKTGNEAIIEVMPKKGEVLKFDLKSGDFDKVRRVGVAVTGADSGQPAAAGIVKLEDSAKKVQTQTLDPGAEGVAQFLDVASGTAKVTVTYGEDRTMSQDVDIPLDRETSVARIDLPVAGGIETIEAAAPTEGSKKGKDGEAVPRRPASRLDWLSGVIGLVLFVLIVYVAYRMLSNRGARFQKILKNLGVDVQPDQQATPAAAQQPAQPVDPTVCPFCGGKKDPATGACACTMGPSGAPTAAIPSGPRLVATQGTYMGGIYPLQAAGVTIGRDESCDIPFPQDATASRRHARITSEDGQWMVRDEGSSNGTFVNGVKVTEQVLKPGDEITVGSTRLRFET